MTKWLYDVIKKKQLHVLFMERIPPMEVIMMEVNDSSMNKCNKKDWVFERFYKRGITNGQVSIRGCTHSLLAT